MYQHRFDRDGPLALRTHRTFMLCRLWYLQAAPADAAALAMFCGGVRSLVLGLYPLALHQGTSRKGTAEYPVGTNPRPNCKYLHKPTRQKPV
jgi:hypothetical protein